MRISARAACVRPHFHTRSEIKQVYVSVYKYFLFQDDTYDFIQHER